MSTADIDREESRSARRARPVPARRDDTGCDCAGGTVAGHAPGCAGLPTLYGGGQP